MNTDKLIKEKTCSLWSSKTSITGALAELGRGEEAPRHGWQVATQLTRWTIVYASKGGIICQCHCPLALDQRSMNYRTTETLNLELSSVLKMKPPWTKRLWAQPPPQTRTMLITAAPPPSKQTRNDQLRRPKTPENVPLRRKRQADIGFSPRVNGERSRAPWRCLQEVEQILRALWSPSLTKLGKV
jgi:hypothetical protein